MYINYLNTAFSTTDNGCISHAMKLLIASIKVFHRLLSFGSGLTRSKTFSSICCDCSASLSFSSSTFNNSVYLLQWCYSKCTCRFVAFLQYETSDKQSRQAALSFTGVSSSLLKNQNVSTCGFYPQGYALFYFPTPFLQLSNINVHM